MAYVNPNFKTKKALKEALALRKRYDELREQGDGALTVGAVMLSKEFPNGTPREIEVFQPGLGTIPDNGDVYIEGPHYPEPHRWYASGKMKNGRLVSVK